MADRIELLAKRRRPPARRPLFDMLAAGPSPLAIAAALRDGAELSDRAFDRFLPDELRIASSQFWTPLLVIRQAVRWLAARGVERVLDIGAGAGKFCVVGALAGRGHFCGIEQRGHLVTVAQELSRLFAVDSQTLFIHGSLASGPLPSADAYYLYNPFGENIYGAGDHLDEEVEFSPQRYAADVAASERLFASAPVGTCVITYNGFGGRMPSSYDRIEVDRAFPNVLCLWQRTRSFETASEPRRRPTPRQPSTASGR